MRLHSCLLLGAAALATAACSLDMSRYASSTPTTSDAGIQTDAGLPLSDGIAHLVIDTNKQYQTLIGFGAAVAWEANTLTGFPSSAPINDDAFRNLGLDIIRLRDRYNHQDLGANGINDELTVLARATASLGHAPKIMLSSWSPPGSLKASGTENCDNTSDTGKANCTLAKDASGAFVYSQFAQYFVDALNYYAAAGVVPDYLSIQNEPNYVPNWEGCQFAETETINLPGYDKALRAVRDALAGSTEVPQIIGPEVISLDGNALGFYVTDQTRSMFDGVAHHDYSGQNWRTPDSFLSAFMNATATANGLPLLETEFDTQNAGAGEGGLETAWVMHNSLTVENVSAFLYWGLAWQGWAATATTPATTPANSLIWVVYDPPPSNPRTHSGHNTTPCVTLRASRILGLPAWTRRRRWLMSGCRLISRPIANS